MNLQEYFREEVKKLKWQKDISYKFIANNLLDMNYNAFINWLRGYKNLGTNKLNKLKRFIKSIK